MKTRILRFVLATLFLFVCADSYSQKSDSLSVKNIDTESFGENFTWPLIVGYEKIIPIGNLAKNMANLDGFHAGFQFKVHKKYIFDMRIFGAFGGDVEKRLIFTYKNTDFDSYIKSIYGAKISVIRQKNIGNKNFSVLANVGIGAQTYNSDKENKHYIKNGVTGEYEEDTDKTSEQIGSTTPVLSCGIGFKKEFSKFPVGINMNYTYAPQNVFGKMIQRGVGGSYFSISVFTGFIIPF